MKTFCNLRMLLLPGSSIIISSLSRLIRMRAEKTAHAHTRHPHKLESEIITPLICQIGGRADFKIIKKEGREEGAWQGKTPPLPTLPKNGEEEEKNIQRDFLHLATPMSPPFIIYIKVMERIQWRFY